MKNLLFLIPLILNLGCAGMKKRELVIDGFEHYVTLFEIEAAKQGRNVIVDDLIINFGDLPGTTIGLCTYKTIDSNVITIDIEYWKNADEESREWLMFHELGHCVMYKDHLDKTLTNGCVASIMNSVALDECYYQMRDYYVKDLFQ